VADPNPYQRWSAAPKHWVELPEQRQAVWPTADLPRHLDALATLLALGATVLLVLLWTV
jgi:hypothetical protein